MGLTFSEFNPALIPWQDTVVDDLECKLDFTSGYHEILLSGSVGSAKTTILAHLIAKHCLMCPGAHVMIGRRSLPDLKGTLYQSILDHLDQEDIRKHYKSNDTRALIKFSNGSLIRGVSWADRRYKKVRSYEFSMVVIEEGTENDDKDYELYKESLMRLRRQVELLDLHEDPEEEDPAHDTELGDLIVRPAIRTFAPRVAIMATNPDSPSHWIYKHFIATEETNRHVYYSLTSDNPFLAPGYMEQIRRTNDPKSVRRMLYGEWLELTQDVVYYNYERDTHFKKFDYKLDQALPLSIMFDFNIGVGKPMSAAIGQFNPVTDHFHVFDEFVIQGARTDSIMEEIAMRGILNFPLKLHVYGDATGESRSTNSIHSDYDLIRKFLSNYKRPDGSSLLFEMRVPRSNPPVRERHNRVNAYLKNDLGQIRFSVYQKCKVTDEGLRLTALKKGADYIEDDSKHFQHITTAIGYWVVYESRLRGTMQARTTAR
jgi:hypothetical protein